MCERPVDHCLQPLQNDDDCSQFISLLDGAPTDFNAFKGSVEEKDFRSRMAIPETQVLLYLRLTRWFQCNLPEVDEVSATARVEKLVKSLSSCTDLSASVVTDKPRETRFSSIYRTYVKSANKPQIKIDKVFSRATERRPNEEWMVRFTIDPQRR